MEAEEVFEEDAAEAEEEVVDVEVAAAVEEEGEASTEVEVVEVMIVEDTIAEEIGMEIVTDEETAATAVTVATAEIGTVTILGDLATGTEDVPMEEEADRADVHGDDVEE